VRIFVAPDALVASEIVIRGDEHRYLAYVRRARVGEAVEVLDGAGRCAAAVIAAIAADATTLRVTAGAEAIAALPPLVRVLLPLIKGDRMDAALEKLVEVGADEVVVWPAARSVVQLADGERRTARLAKYEAQLRAAARQCGRAAVPTVRYADSLHAALVGLHGDRFVLDPAADTPLAITGASTVTFASGPEGGLTPDELAALAAASFTGIALGPRVMRAETAPAIAVALIRAATRS
jgi:16S rRNA (uracil1498-N3)-methyltransferase